MSKELDKPNHMSEKHSELPWRYNAHYKVIHYSKAGLIEGAKSVCDMRGENADANAAFIIEACNNYEAVKKERDEAVRIAEQARQYVWARLTDKLIDSERELLDRLEQQINELLNK